MFWKILLGILIFVIVITIISVYMAVTKMKRMNRAKEVKKGMDEKQAFDILGKGWDSKEELPNYTKYVWEIKNQSYQGIKKVTLEVKNGKVLQVFSSK